MGRSSSPFDTLDPEAKLYAQHCGGDGYYDRGGAYWGHSRTYAVWTRGGAWCAYVEATGKDEAIRLVRLYASEELAA